MPRQIFTRFEISKEPEPWTVIEELHEKSVSNNLVALSLKIALQKYKERSVVVLSKSN
jgi:hypothetical protein